MTSAETWTVTDAASNTLGSASFQLDEDGGANDFIFESVTVPADATLPLSLTVTGFPDVVATNDSPSCLPPPDYRYTGVCEEGVAIFTVTNNGGPATSTTAARIINNDTNEVLQDGLTIPALGNGESVEFTQTGLEGGPSIALQIDSGEFFTVAVVEQGCIPLVRELEVGGTCNPDGTANFSITNNGTVSVTVSWEIINPADNNVLGDGSVTVAPGETVNINSGFIVDGPLNFVVKDAASGDIIARATVPDCFIQTETPIPSATPTFPPPPVVTDTPTPLTSTPTPTPVTPTPTPVETEEPTEEPPVTEECGEIVEEDEFGYPVLTYDASLCEENVELPRDDFETIEEIGPKVCPDWVIYSSNEGGQFGVWRTPSTQLPANANPQLSGPVNEDEEDNFVALAPSQSPDARFVAFATNRDGNFEIYIAQVDNTGEAVYFERATFNTIAVNMDPMWSPGNDGGFDGGELIVYESARRGFWALYMLNVVTGEEVQLTDNSSYNSLNAFWHPDGDRFIFQTDRDGFWQIYELDLTQTGEDGFPLQTRLTDGVGDYLDPVYNADGTQIAVRSNRDGINNVIYVMDADGSNLESISDGQSDATNAVWSPEENLLVYEAVRDADRDIFVYDFDTEQTRVLTNNDFLDYAPTWRCDTTNVIFASETQGAPDVFETNALPIDAFGVAVDPEIDGDLLIQLTESLFADTFPQGVPAEENGSRLGALPGGRILQE